MAVPEIKVPSAQPEAMPSPVQPEPPQGAFAGSAIGSGLEKGGEALFGVGWESYHKAAEAIAQKQETIFMQGALQIRDKYRNLYNEDAIKAHEQASKDLENLRAKTGDSLSSKYAHALYSNNSLRRAGFVQESIDSHFEHENKSFQDLTYRNWQETMTRFVTTKAGETPYNAKAIEETIKEIQVGAKQKAESMGLHGDLAEEVGVNETKKATDALFRMLLDPKAKRDPDLIEKELKKYTGLGMVDAERQKDAQHALGGRVSDVWVSKTMANFLRYDFDGNTDPEGHIKSSDVLKAQGELANDDPNRQQKIDNLEREYARHIAFQNRAGAELMDLVKRQGSADGGRFAIPERSMDWQKLQRLHPELATALRDKADEKIYRTEQRDIKNIKLASGAAFGATRFYLDKMTPEEIRDFTPAQVSLLMSENYHGPGSPAPEDQAKALEFWNKLKTGKLDPIERKFGQIASQALEEGYKGNKTKARAAMNIAHYILDDAYSASIKNGKPMSENDLRERLVKEFTKKDGLFGTSFGGSRSGESYVRRPATKSNTQEFATGSDAWKLLQPGVRFRFKSDPLGTWRTR